MTITYNSLFVECLKSYPHKLSYGSLVVLYSLFFINVTPTQASLINEDIKEKSIIHHEQLSSDLNSEEGDKTENINSFRDQPSKNVPANKGSYLITHNKLNIIPHGLGKPGGLGLIREPAGFMAKRVTSLFNNGLERGYPLVTQGYRTWQPFLLPPVMRSELRDPSRVASQFFKRAETLGAFKVNQTGHLKMFVLPEFWANGYREVQEYIDQGDDVIKDKMVPRYDSSQPIESREYDQLISEISKEAKKWKNYSFVIIPGTVAVRTGELFDNKEYIENKGTMIVSTPGHPLEHIHYSKQFESPIDGRDKAHFLFKAGTGPKTILLKDPIGGTICSYTIHVCLDHHINPSNEVLHVVVANGTPLSTTDEPSKFYTELIVCDSQADHEKAKELGTRSGIYVKKFIEMQPGLEGFLRNLDEGADLSLAISTFFKSFIVPTTELESIAKKLPSQSIRLKDGSIGIVGKTRDFNRIVITKDKLEGIREFLKNKESNVFVPSSKEAPHNPSKDDHHPHHPDHDHHPHHPDHDHHPHHPKHDHHHV